MDKKPTDIRYCFKHDARYDAIADKWIESKCSDTCGCEYCKGRPEKPSMVKEDN